MIIGAVDIGIPRFSAYDDVIEMVEMEKIQFMSTRSTLHPLQSCNLLLSVLWMGGLGPGIKGDEDIWIPGFALMMMWFGGEEGVRQNG